MIDDKTKAIFKEDYENGAFHPKTTPKITMTFEEAWELTKDISDLEKRRWAMRVYAMSRAEDEYHSG